MRGSRRMWAWLGAVVLTALITLLRIHTVDNLDDQGYFTKYLKFSKANANGTIDRSRLPDLSPGYLWLMTLVHGELDVSRETIRTGQIVAVSVAALCTAAAAEAVAGPIAAIASGAFVLGSRAALLNATDFEPETCILLLQALALIPLLRARMTWRSALIAGAMFGLSAIFRPSAIPTAVAIAVWLAFQRERSKAALFAVACAIPIVITLMINASRTGTAVIMDPGTVFYEGMNPLATGYAGVQPRIISDLYYLGGPDALHVTFRMVASRASAAAASTEEANRFWAKKAVAFARTHPMSAVELVGRKFLAAISSYDAWDLGKVVLKEYELARMPAVPFAFTLATAFAALWLPDRRRLLPVAMVVFFGIGAMVGTYVTARQRNAIIPATAVLAGCGVAALVRMRGRRLWLTAAAILTAGTLLTLETNRAAEDRYVWKTNLEIDAARARAKAARDPGELALALGVAQLSGDETLSRQGRPVVLQLGRRAIEEPVADPVAFNAALALARNHYWREAETILVRLLERGYIPERRSRVASSLHYHLARALLRQGRGDGIAALLENARVDTPGDADVLALSFATGSGDARAHAKELATLHDRFTAELALVRALIDTGRRSEAAPRVAKLQREFPEWGRPAQVLRSW